jgi:hypothetical protein
MTKLADRIPEDSENPKQREWWLPLDGCILFPDALLQRRTYDCDRALGGRNRCPSAVKECEMKHAELAQGDREIAHNQRFRFRIPL